MSEYTDVELEMKKEINRLRSVVREQQDIIKDIDDFVIKQFKIYEKTKRDILKKGEDDTFTDLEKRISVYWLDEHSYKPLLTIRNLIHK